MPETESVTNLRTIDLKINMLVHGFVTSPPDTQQQNLHLEQRKYIQ